MSSTRPTIILIAVLLALPGPEALAQMSTTVPDKVEEDWQLVIATTDSLGIGPQITTCMTPVSDNSTPFVAFDLNYREYPVFQAGGMQVQVWSNNQVSTTSSEQWAQFGTNNETITWTQQMSVSNGYVYFEIDNGQSKTWGKFGQGTNLVVSFPAQVNALANYKADVSAANSGVSWESNLVTSLTLVQVRYYSGNQIIKVDTIPRTIVSNP